MEKRRKVKLLWGLFFTFFKISPVSFGGGYAMIPLLEDAVTKKNKWVKREDIADVLVVAQSVPGSIAVNTATFIGYRLVGIPGAIAATLGIITPTFIIIVALASLFLNFQHNPIVQTAFIGIRSAVIALIIFAALKIGKTAIFNKTTSIIACVALVIFLFVSIHPIFMLLVGGIVGILLNMKRLLDRKKTINNDKVENIQ
ncbi:chromate transporter [Oceanobacillus polygoni]|uniref:Chromate transporter n=1 Tax=Oceanobacillus polygoni TaxID=1235259 RepID=A0A9X0YRQ8_9BACI|nr:chromate transporter [Oceanobacillus polygoni]MBP2076034.1 chromate transporter [Oceanobacillus polygoni]